MSVFVCVCECAYQEEIKLEITRIIYKQYCEAPKNKFKTLKIEILLQERVFEWINSQPLEDDHVNDAVFSL